MWGLFAGEARKQPPHIPFSTAIPKDPEKSSCDDEGQQVKVFLTGSLISGGVCDDPRILAQLDQTVRQAAGVAEAAIFINDRPLEDWFSQK